MITFLSGGTGTPKLIRGMRSHLPDSELSVVVNTAEDIWVSGNHLSPDLDTVMYLFAGWLNTETWWGISGDTFTTHDAALGLGVDEYIKIGDRDRAVQIARAELLRQGRTLTEVTKVLCTRMGVSADILPMSDGEVTTMIRSGQSEFHFQEYWIRHQGRLPVDAVLRYAPTGPVATVQAVTAIMQSDLVIIGPSNPITSILPILECEGIISALMDAVVVAVSPFIGNSPVSGPAGDLMQARGYSPDSLSVWKLYEEYTDVFIQDLRDPIEVPGSVRLDTLMTSQEKSTELAGEILRLSHAF